MPWGDRGFWLAPASAQAQPSQGTAQGDLHATVSRGLGSLAGEENASSHWVDDVGSGPCVPHPEQKPSEWAASFSFLLDLFIYLIEV